MTGMTRVYAFKTEAEATNSAMHWKARDYHVAIAGPTDAIRLANGEDDPEIWESGEEADWHIVLASKSVINVMVTKIPEPE